jgi:membrane protein
LNWRTFVGRLWARINDHDIFGSAAQLSYYFLLALFPLLLFLMTLLGYFAEAGSELRNKLIAYLAAVMPSSAITLVYTTLDEIYHWGSWLRFGRPPTAWERFATR